MTYIQLDIINSDLLEQKNTEPAFDPNIFALITDGDESEVRDFEVTGTYAEVLAELEDGEIVAVDTDVLPSDFDASIFESSQNGYWSGVQLFIK